MSALSLTTPRTTPTSRWVVLVIACLAQFMVVLDATIVNVALPSIQRGLHFSTSTCRGSSTPTRSTFGGFLLLGGRPPTCSGDKRLFAAGIALFALPRCSMGSPSLRRC